MKRSASAAISLLLGLLAGTTEVDARDDFLVEEDGIVFDVRRFDDGRSRPYHLQFSLDDIDVVKYTFSDEGRIMWVKADTEKYAVKYKSNGSFKKIVRRDSGARMLLGDERAEEAEFDQEDIDEEHGVTFDHRRLYPCADCGETWNILCDGGVQSICDVVGNDVFGAKGGESVSIACETLGSACARLSANEACEDQCIPEGQCVCVPVESTDHPPCWSVSMVWNELSGDNIPPG